MFIILNPFIANQLGYIEKHIILRMKKKNEHESEIKLKRNLQLKKVKTAGVRLTNDRTTEQTYRIWSSWGCESDQIFTAYLLLV